MPPSCYTGELYGVQYLFAQSNLQLPSEEELDIEIDEGFGDYDDLVADVTAPVVDDETISPLTADEESSGDEVSLLF